MNNENAPSKLSRTPVAVLLAMICCFLWGSAFPCIKIGYKLFEMRSDGELIYLIHNPHLRTHRN